MDELDSPARDEHEPRARAITHLLSISSGETAYDFEAAQAIHAEREASRR